MANGIDEGDYNKIKNPSKQKRMRPNDWAERLTAKYRRVENRQERRKKAGKDINNPDKLSRIRKRLTRNGVELPPVMYDNDTPRALEGGGDGRGIRSRRGGTVASGPGTSRGNEGYWNNEDGSGGRGGRGGGGDGGDGGGFTNWHTPQPRGPGGGDQRRGKPGRMPIGRKPGRSRIPKFGRAGPRLGKDLSTWDV